MALGVLLTAVVWNDITTHRIENVSVLAILLLGLISQLLGAGVPGIMQWLAGMAVGLGFLLPFYIGGGMAAGDVKLLAAVGSVLGPLPAVLAGGVTLFAGAALGMFAMHMHKVRNQQHSPQEATAPAQAAATVDPRKQRLPYAAAIAAGAAGGMLYSGHLQDFFGALT